MIVDTKDGLIVTAREMMDANPLTCPTIPFQLYEGYADLADVPAPEHDPLTHRVERAAYAMRDGDSWVPQYSVIALTQAEIDAARKALVPPVISRAQGKAALISAGMWAPVLGFVDAIADPVQKALAEVALHDTTEWRRDSPFLGQASAALGMTDRELDDLFTTAGQIVL